jgi:anti-sigma28 factor (negative regulator of flagellin synthesis)
MSKESLRNKLHEIVDSIEDEQALSILMEDAVMYQTRQTEEVDADGLTASQWAKIEESRQQIRDGHYKTYEEVKAHFDKWLTK